MTTTIMTITNMSSNGNYFSQALLPDDWPAETGAPRRRRRSGRRGPPAPQRLCIYIYIYIYIQPHTCIYIYTYRETERDREREICASGGGAEAACRRGTLPLPGGARCGALSHAFHQLSTLLDLCVSSLRRGHANLLRIVPSLTDDPRMESDV